ncbi:YqeG family HAD IIIA-type phosphatase [Leptotrichia sp. oral taxon 223]|uniref:YqeG family HAD IIIA-type phosphatase n=1 Tax=Leptotrichia sp. oral taxon 223 TaxID=712363 RepID=UPI0015C04292|nr:YqeG family HAD IIIA-type phosphatase [Leptotrichia sp. oral taxon 223]NWO18805.1 YqeG family HAD IIIA-type phosphatase [Leptotrichia sp. oral taxon 223]
MFKIFYPYEYVKNVFSIDYDKLYGKGYRGLIFDIDNTLVHHGDDSTDEVDELFKYIQQIGFKTIILSNNSEERVKRFLKNINSLYIYDAKKPATLNYLKAIEKLGLKKEEAAVIGDQIFTDIWGANKSGIPSILVEYLRKENETKIGKKRQIEKIILMFYKRNKACQHRIGNIVKEEV